MPCFLSNPFSVATSSIIELSDGKASRANRTFSNCWPTATFADAPPLDLLFVPGGYGQIAATDDAETIAWLAAQPWSNGKVGMLGRLFAFGYIRGLMHATA